MTSKEFAEYIVKNMHRATQQNALNISGKLDKEYDFKELVENIIGYVREKVDSGSGEFSKKFLYKLSSCCYMALSDYTTLNLPNKNMLFDMFVLNLWEILNGNKTA